jgi:GGDEF domain-containing protein
MHDLAAHDGDACGEPTDPRLAAAFADLAETLHRRDRPVRAALGRLGESLGADGWPLPQVHGWVGVVAARVPRRMRHELTDIGATAALSRGWAEQHVRGAYAAACIDPITGLATPLVFGVRLHETFAYCRSRSLDAHSEYVIAIVDLDLPPTLTSAGRLDSEALLITAAALVSGSFDSDEVVARCGTRVAILMPRRALADGRLMELQADLEHVVGSTRPIIWIDELPDDAADVELFVEALSAEATA